MADGLTRLSPARRRTLRLVGGIFLAAGVLLFMLAPVMMFSSMSTFMGGGGFGAFGFAPVFGFGGIFLIAIGAFMLQMGTVKAMSEIMATETGGAVEYSTAAWGRGLGRGIKESGLSLGSVGGGQVVKVKCRNCGYLDSEDARFCSQCSKPM